MSGENESLKERVEKALAKLGKTPERIAKRLSKQRVVGDLGSGDSCPLRNYLEREVPGVGLFVDPDWIETAETRGCVGDAVVELTDAQKMFVQNFDEGKYPDLIDKHEPLYSAQANET